MEEEIKNIAKYHNCEILNFTTKKLCGNRYVNFDIKYPDTSISNYKDKYFTGHFNGKKIMLNDFSSFLDFTIKHFGTK